MLLDRGGSETLAARLINIYFSFFKVNTNDDEKILLKFHIPTGQVSVSKGEVDTKLMKALLTGVNR